MWYRSAVSKSLSNFPYLGAAGQTRTEPVLIPVPSGDIRSIAIHVAVNVTSDPELRSPALAGGLHRFEGGEELAVPFVFHDAAAFKFALVVPKALRHRALTERAALLTRIAEDAAHPVPAYVAPARLVVGFEELKRYLDEKSDPNLTSEALAGRERDLVEREARIKARAQTLLSQEDDARALSERLEAERAALFERERLIETRELSMRERERNMETRVASSPGMIPSLSATLPLPQVSPPSAEVVHDEELSMLDSVDHVPLASVVADTELEELPDDLEELPDEEAAAALEEPSDDVDAEFEDADAEDFEDVPADAIEEARDDEPREEPTQVVSVDMILPSTDRVRRPNAGAPVPPPAHFLRDSHMEMAASLIDGHVWLFARTGEDREDVFTDGVELLVQYLAVSSHPVALLALVDRSTEGRPYVRRAALDPKTALDLRVLNSLKRHFTVRVGLFGASGQFLREFTIEDVPRKENLNLIIERAKRQAPTGIDAATAMERALAAPPPVRINKHPFAPIGDDATIADVMTRVEELDRWVPAKLDLALFALSIPKTEVDAVITSTLSLAKDHGIAIGEALLPRILPENAESSDEVITSLFEAFRDADHEPLTAKQIKRNWSSLLKLATQHEVVLPTKLHLLAWNAVNEEAKDEIDHDALSAEEQLTLLTHPSKKKAIALALIKGATPEGISAALRAARTLEEEALLEVIAGVIEVGEPAGDALIDMLSARKAYVRHTAVLALGELTLRRAITPLVQLLQSETTDLWEDVARNLARFGSGALRPIARALKSPNTDESRFAYTLAHLMIAGFVEPIEKMQRDGNTHVARVATSAFSQQEASKRHVEVVMSERDADEASQTFDFARRFVSAQTVNTTDR